MLQTHTSVSLFQLVVSIIVCPNNTLLRCAINKFEALDLKNSMTFITLSLQKVIGVMNMAQSVNQEIRI